MRIAIIGAGPAGLAALRHSLQEHHICEAFEQTGFVGGTWNYTDEVGINEFGLPVHSSMYQGLRTNLPKELMQFEDFPFESPEQSYVSQSDVLKYIRDYAEKFQLMTYIKFFTTVLKVSPLDQGRWSLEVKDLKLGSIERKTFDAVFVCVGNHKTPFLPAFQGVETFQGATIHSHSFRKLGPYADKKVLIVGSGPSGTDIARLMSTVAKKVILSHRSPFNPLAVLPEKIQKKPEIQEFKEHSVVFKDGTEEDIDNVIFCTGYLYSFPFLSEKCKIKVEGKFTKNKNDMMDDLTVYMNKRRDRGIPDGKAHQLNLDQGVYMNDLTITASIRKVPMVFIKLYKFVRTDVRGGNTKLSYRILNENEFEVFEKNIKIG